jgi:hypothetical protein
MEPESPADRAFVGMIGQDDVPAPMWTAICRESGWDDCIVRKGMRTSNTLRLGVPGWSRVARLAPIIAIPDAIGG